MVQVFDFNKFKENKKKKEIERVEILNNQSYFFSLGEDVEVNFGGAFIREIVNKKEENRENIIQAIHNIHKDQVVKCWNELPPEISNFYANMLISQETILYNCMNYIEDQETLDSCFEEDSEFVEIIPLLVVVIMAVSYEKHDYEKMEKDNYLKIGPSIDKLIKNKYYNQVLSVLDNKEK